MEKPAADPSNHSPPEVPLEPLEFLARTWNLSAFEDDVKVKGITGLTPVRLSFAASDTSQMVLERIMSQSQQEISSPRTSGGLLHSNGPLISTAHYRGGSFADCSPPISPSDVEDVKNRYVHRPTTPRFASSYVMGGAASGSGAIGSGNSTGSRTVGRWLKDRREKKKEQARAQSSQLHAAVQVAGVAAAVASVMAATASQPDKDYAALVIDVAVASAATLVAAQCVEAAECLGAERDHLTSVVESATKARSAGDMMTLIASAATALRGAATLKSRALKEVWNIAAVIPVVKGVSRSSGGDCGELLLQENMLELCSKEFLSRGSDLLKRTRKGHLHWKRVAVYVNRMDQVVLKMKSGRGTRTVAKKKKKTVVLEVKKDMPLWPGRDQVEGWANFRYFGLKTVTRGLIQFECKSQREYDLWTKGVTKLLATSAENNCRRRRS